MDISDRKKTILKAVIDEYIETAEPVGSKAIAANSDLALSPATIRNEMADLESLGLLEQPHTSAGRIPSPAGYRLYVDELMQQHKLTLEETDTINRSLNARIIKLDRLIENSGRVLAQLTNYPAFAVTTAARRPTVQRLDFIAVEPRSFIAVLMADPGAIKNKLIRAQTDVNEDYLKKLATVLNTNLTGLNQDGITQNLISASERAMNDMSGIVAVVVSFVLEVLGELEGRDAYLEGTSRLFEQPEYRNVDRAARVLNYLSDDDGLMQLMPPNDEKDMHILIGPENVAEELRDTSVIMAKYELGDNMQGLIGVVGPTRMDYAKIAAKLGYFAESMTRLLGGGDNTPRDDE